MNKLVATLGRRVLTGIVTLFALATVLFFVVRVVGSPITILLSDQASPQQIAALEKRLGFDQPLIMQYLHYLGGLVTGDAGDSWFSRIPASELVFSHLGATLKLAAIAMSLAVVVAIPIGVLSARRPGSAIDSLSRIGAVLGQSLPAFWLGILLVLLFAVALGWFPAGGDQNGFMSLVLPGVALSAYSIPLTMRLTRSAMLEVLDQDFIRTARSKGLTERKVVFKHAFRNALIPIITVLALRVGHVVGGAVTLEMVFAYPGVGSLAIDSMLRRDYPVVQLIILVVAAMVIVLNLIADLLYTIVDPRVRVSK